METNRPVERVGTDPPEKTPARVPWRALIAGALLLPPLTLFGHLSYIIVQSAVWTADTLLRGPVTLLFLLTCWSLAWWRLSPRLARYLSFSRSELALVYLMATVGTALAGECWAVYVVPGLAGTAVYQAETSRPEWADWLRHTPSWFYVRDPQVILDIHRGNSTLYQARHLRALAVPVFAWGTLMLALALFAQSLAQLMRRQWIHRERLSFPLVALPLALLDTTSPRPWWRNRVFWIGIAVSGTIELVNGLNYLFPTLPYIPVKVTQFAAASSRPWSGVGPIWVAFYPWVIGVGYLVPLEISFSLWFFFWLGRAQDVVATVAGLRTSGGYAPMLPPYHIHQATGAFLVMGLLLLWRVRRDVVGLWGQALEPANRRARLGVLGSAFVALLWAAAARIPLPLAAGFLLVYGLFAIVLGRLIGESGCSSNMSPLPVHETLELTGTLERYPQQALVAFGWWHNLGERQSDNLLTHQMTAMRLATDVDAQQRVHLILAAGAVVGIAAGIWSLLHIYSHYGIMSAKVRGWPARDAPQYAYNLIHGWLHGGLEVQRDQLVALGAGGLVVAALMWLRHAYLGWPLHPIGFLVAGNWGMQEVWCPFFVAWLVKLMVLRFGGIRLYRSLLPFFLGAILGDYLIPMGWAIVGLLSKTQMYLSYPH